MRRLFIGLLPLVLPIAALAATQGSEGPDSTGTLEVTVTIPSLVRITSVADLDFGNYSGSGPAALADDLCIYSNASGGLYRITARGNGDNNAFTVRRSGSTEVIPYVVRWNDEMGTAGSIALTADVISANQSGAVVNSQTCGGGFNANFEVSFTQHDILSRPAGMYTGTLSLIVSPPA